MVTFDHSCILHTVNPAWLWDCLLAMLVSCYHFKIPIYLYLAKHIIQYTYHTNFLPKMSIWLVASPSTTVCIFNVQCIWAVMSFPLPILPSCEILFLWYEIEKGLMVPSSIYFIFHIISLNGIRRGLTSLFLSLWF